MPRKFYTKLCANCGKEFSTNEPRQRCCSRKCSGEYAKAHRPEHSTHPMPTKTQREEQAQFNAEALEYYKQVRKERDGERQHHKPKKGAENLDKVLRKLSRTKTYVSYGEYAAREYLEQQRKAMEQRRKELYKS